MDLQSITPAHAVQLIAFDNSVRGVDVRSEDEFKKGAIPKFINIPILNNSERREVGICYKNRGQQAAIELGHKLVDGHRDRLVEQWGNYLQETEWPLLTCWRGGLRSETAAKWIQSAGQKVIRIEGGTKALRNEFLKELSAPPPFYVIAGPTGSGKTQLLDQFERCHVDLEKFACHRGSSFGALLRTPQPSQTTFENEIAIRFVQLRDRARVLIEDESVAIGSLRVPQTVVNEIKSSAIIRLNVNIEDRVTNILGDYVKIPLETGIDSSRLEAHYETCLFRIRTRLGGQMHALTLESLKTAFKKSNFDLHRQWIRLLLENYYDKAYQYAESRLKRPIAFEGDWDQCRNWIQNQFA